MAKDGEDRHGLQTPGDEFEKLRLNFSTCAGADPGFDEGGSDKRPPKAEHLKYNFQRFQGQFEVV